MTTIAYLRVSTVGQDLDQQRLAILDYAQKHRVTVDTFVETQRSSQQTTQRSELMQMIEGLQPGDRLIVSELSRFGRSLGQILQIIDLLIQKGVRLVAIKEAIRFEGKQNLQTKAMIALFGLFAEIERDLIAERTKEGLAAAKSTRQTAGAS
jgi:DNA invertase Pin-like site-specific DNA recombinase